MKPTLFVVAKMTTISVAEPQLNTAVLDVLLGTLSPGSA